MKFLNSKLIKIALYSLMAACLILDGLVATQIIKSTVWHLIFISLLVLTGIGNALYDSLKDNIEFTKVANAVFSNALDLSVLSLLNGNGFQIRANIMVVNKKKNKLGIMFHSKNMKNDKDLELIFEKWQGCAGKAWGYRTSILATSENLSEEKRGDWALTEKQFSLSNRLKTIYSCPINKSNDEIIGILSYDTESDLKEYFTRTEIRNIIADNAAFISQLLIMFNIVRVLPNSD